MSGWVGGWVGGNVEVLAAYHPSGSLRSNAYCLVISAGARGAATGSRVGSCFVRHAW